MSHVSIPSKFWNEMFSSIVYLINRLPSTNSTPYHILFNKQPDCTKLHVFGCVCFPFTRPYNDHKLQFQSQPCVFIGYGISQKGYRCLDLSSNRIYVSRNIQFDENTFPFKSSQLSAQQTDPQLCLSVTLPLFQPLIASIRLFKKKKTLPLFPSSAPQLISKMDPQTSPSPQPNTMVLSPLEPHVSPSPQPASLAHSGPIRPPNPPTDPSTSQACDSSFLSSPADPPTDPSNPSPQPIPSFNLSSPSPSHPTQTPVDSSTHSSVPPSSSLLNTHPMTTRTKDKTIRPRNFFDFIAHHAALDFEPTTFNQALKSSN